MMAILFLNGIKDIQVSFSCQLKKNIPVALSRLSFARNVYQFQLFVPLTATLPLVLDINYTNNSREMVQKT